jgi:A/G-specific adenine glycosylase
MANKGMKEFKKVVWDYYRKNRRSMLWREVITPYGIFVSEIMLQQTQVSRIVGKYTEFIKELPTFDALADASLSQLLSLWQGIGYNRRALYMQRSAQLIVRDYNGLLPQDPNILVTFPGIGKATAASIVVYAYNRAVPFIETNVRRVFIHHFFGDKINVDDKELWPFVEEAMQGEDPREWYYALMDYGTMLAKTIPNPNKKSKHYVVQSKFEGSRRQLRGKILNYLLAAVNDERPVNAENIVNTVKSEPDTVYSVLDELKEEGFVMEKGGEYRIK